MANTVPKLITDTKPQIQEACRTPSRVNANMYAETGHMQTAGSRARRTSRKQPEGKPHSVEERRITSTRDHRQLLKVRKAKPCTIIHQKWSRSTQSDAQAMRASVNRRPASKRRGKTSPRERKLCRSGGQILLKK